MNRQEAIDKFFTKHPFGWLRCRDGYKFDTEEMNLAIDHYLKTGNKP
jgi:hypothetical protein